MLAFVLSDPTYDKAHFDYNPGQSIVQQSKFDFWVAGWVLAINFWYFRNCLIS